MKSGKRRKLLLFIVLAQLYSVTAKTFNTNEKVIFSQEDENKANHKRDSNIIVHSSNADSNFKLKKCCQTNYILRIDEQGKSSSCVKSAPNQNNNLLLSSSGEHYKIDYDNSSLQMPKCNGRGPTILHNRDGIWYKFFENQFEIKIGLDYFMWAAWIPIDKTSYCVDMDEIGWKSCSENATDPDHPTFTVNNIHCREYPLLLFCELDKDVLQEFTIHRYIFGISSVSTCIPILATLFLYFYLNIHHKIRRWILISYFVSYSFTVGFHGAQILLYINNLEQDATIWCKLFNHLFVYFACVFGTACMFVSLDIFWCFWRMNSHLGIINPSKTGVILCLLITWIVPLILYVVGEALREIYWKETPDLGWKKCLSLNFDLVELLLMIQFVFKFGIYLSTSLLIYKHKKSTSFATPRAQRDFNEMTTLYLKLFLTTGMPFICLAIDYIFADKNPMSVWWFIIRFPHSAIGLYIFIVFGLSKEVRDAWRKVWDSNEDKEMKALKNSNVSDFSNFERSCKSERTHSSKTIWSVMSTRRRSTCNLN